MATLHTVVSRVEQPPPPRSPLARALRVAVVSETYPPEVNGVAATLSRVVQGLLRRGHEVQLVRPRQHAGDAASSAGGLCEVLVRGLPIPRYPQLRMGLPSRRMLAQLWQTQRPDVVHLVTEGPLGWSALQAARQLELPLVSDFRTNFHAYSQHYGLAWLHQPIVSYLRRFHNRCACTMVPTPALGQELTHAGFDRLRVVARGVDTELFDPARRSAALRAKWGVADEGRVALCVGRLAPEKNLGLLLQAFAAMQQLHPDWRLVLVGEGPERAALQQRCPQAVFAGLRHGEDLAAHYASADAFLFPSGTETFGNVVPEAMASGLPVLAFDQAAAGQLITSGGNGVVVASHDTAGFVQAAARMANTPQWLRAMGQQARQRAMRLDWGQIVAAIEAEYHAAMAAVATSGQAHWHPTLPATRVLGVPDA